MILELATDEGNPVPILPIAACVCRAWRNAVYSEHHLWTFIDMFVKGCHPKDAVFKNLGYRWIDLVIVSLSGCNAVTDAGLAALVDVCPRIESLNLSYCEGMKEKGLSEALCTMLMRPNDDYYSPLRILDLSSIQIKPDAGGLDRVLRNILMAQSKNPAGPVLLKLFVEECPNMSDRPWKEICDASLAAGKPLLDALEVLSVSRSGGERVQFEINILRLQITAPNLQDIDVCAGNSIWKWSISDAGLPEGAAESAGWPFLHTCDFSRYGERGYDSEQDIAVLRQMISKSPLLETLNFSMIGGIDYLDFIAAFPKSSTWRGLKSLWLGTTYTSCASDEEGGCKFSDMADLCPWMEEKLEELVVSEHGARFTDRDCEALTRFKKLKLLDISKTSISDTGIKAIMSEMRKKVYFKECMIDMTGCRNVSRKVRLAASLGMPQLILALEEV